MERMRGIVVSSFVTALFVAAGWIGRGWFQGHETHWANTLFTAQVLMPVLLASGWFATHDALIRSRFIRFVVSIGVLAGVGVWFVNLTEPLHYKWTDGLPFVIALVLALAAGISVLAAAKPHLPDWPLFELPQRVHNAQQAA